MKAKKENKPQVEEQLPGRSVRAKVKFVRISPRKVRLVINTIRFQNPNAAFRILMTLNKKAARLAEKVLKTAVANAKVLQLDESRLYISDVRADGGPTLKRFIERSMGRGDRILKRTTHLALTLSESNRKPSAPAAPAVKHEEKESAKSGKKPSGRKKTAGAVA